MPEEGRHTATPGRAADRFKRIASNVGWTVLFGGMFVVVAGFVTGIVLDGKDQQWVTCGVHSAKPDRDKSGNFVDVATSCGQMQYRVGIQSADQAKAVARKFTPSSDYEFKLGWTSRVVFTRWPVFPPDARAWRAASRSARA